MALDLLIRLVAQDNASNPIRSARQRTEELTAALERLRASGTASAEDIAAAQRDLEDHLRSAAGQAEQLHGKLEKFRNTGAALAAVGAGMMVLSNRLSEMGASLAESEDLVQQAFGNQTQAIRNWSNDLQNELGVVGSEVRKSAAIFDIMFGAMGIADEESLKMAKGLTQLGLDLESLYDLDPGEGFEKLKSGITGETEPLKALGIILSEDVVKTYAYANGIAALGEELTEQQKVAARYGAIMEMAADAHGNLAKTADSAQNTAKRMQNAITISEQAVAKGAAEAQKNIDNLTMRMMAFIAVSPDVAHAGGHFLTVSGHALTAAGSILGVASQVGMLTLASPAFGAALSGAFVAIKASAVAAGTAIWGAIAPILPLVLAIAAVMAAITAGAVFLQKRAQKEAEAKGEATDREFYNTVKGRDGARPGESFEDWRKRTGRTPGAMNADDTDDPTAINDALQNAQKIANGQMSVPTMPTSGVSAVGLAMGEDDAETASATTTSKEAKKAAKDAIKAAAKAERDKAKSLKEIERANKKEAAALAKLEDKKQNYAADIERARIEEEIATGIAAWESGANGGDEAEIKRRVAILNANKIKALADIEARAIQDDDPARAASLRQIADMRAQGTLDRLAFTKTKGGNPIAAAIAGVMAGGGLPGSSGGRVSSGGGSGGGGGTISVDIGKHSRVMTGANGVNYLEFFGKIPLPVDNFRQSASAYAGRS